MSLRNKIWMLASMLLLIGVVGGLWQFLSFLRLEQSRQALSQAETEVRLARQVASSLNEKFQADLMRAIAREQTARLNLGASEEQANKLFLETDYLAIGLLKATGQEQWQEAWLRERTSLTEKWKKDFLRTVIQELPTAGVKAENVTWFRTLDPQAQALFVLMTLTKIGGEDFIALAFLSAPSFSAVADGFRASATEALLVDERGFALAYTEQQYVGHNVEAHPAVNELLKRREVLSSALTRNRNQEKLAAASARVPNTNLYVITSRPLPSIWPIVGRLGASGGILVLALVLVGLAFSLLIARPYEVTLNYLKNQIKSVAFGEPVRYPQDPQAKIADLQGAIEKLVTTDQKTPEYIVQATQERVDLGKMDAYKEISVGLSQALRDPLASVLAQAQLARAKVTDDQLKPHFVIIERETRRARDTIEHLLKITGEEKFPKQRTELQEVVLAALAALKKDISSHAIKVHKNLAASAPVQVHPGQLQTAIEEVLRNAIESLAQQSVENRNLKLVTRLADGHVILDIEDNGEGTSVENISRVFEPFFTTKNSDEHKGLGLTVAKGIMKNLGGHIQLLANEGPGCRVVFELPASGAALAQAEREPTVAKEDPVDGSGPVDLGNPLSGSRIDDLPAAPAIDEVTFTSIPTSTDLAPDETVPVRQPRVKDKA